MKILTFIVLLSSCCLVAQGQTTVVKDKQIVLTKDVKSFVGQYKTIEGNIVQVKLMKRSKGDICYFNFTDKYPKNDFTVVIFQRDHKKFDNLKKYANKAVRVTGKVKLYKGRYQIIINNPRQIKIVEGK